MAATMTMMATTSSTSSRVKPRRFMAHSRRQPTGGGRPWAAGWGEGPVGLVPAGPVADGAAAGRDGPDVRLQAAVLGALLGVLVGAAPPRVGDRVHAVLQVRQLPVRRLD